VNWFKNRSIFFYQKLNLMGAFYTNFMSKVSIVISFMIKNYSDLCNSFKNARNFLKNFEILPKKNFPKIFPKNSTKGLLIVQK